MQGEHLGDGTGGVWTASQARSAGLSPDQVEHARATGRWQTLRRGVYLDGGVQPGLDHLTWAAVLALGGPGRALAAGRTAARLHGLPLVDDDDPATGRREREHDDVVVSGPRRGSRTLHPYRWSYAPGELGTIRGCPVPSLGRTLWDCRLVLRHDALVCALDAALHSRRVTVEELQARAARGAGARGSRAFAAAVRLADGRAESPLETLTRLALLPVLPGLQPQVEVRDGWGRLLARVDLGLPELRLGVEADGASHRGALSLAADRARERRTGWTFERVVWAEVRRAAGGLRRRVVATADRLRREQAA